jgi:CRISPR-associated protein Cas6
MPNTNSATVSSVDAQSFVDVSFPLRGRLAPSDHGYALYSAICRLIPEAHEGGWLAVHPLPGRRADGVLMLPARAFLTIRVHAKDLARLLPLSGQTLALGLHVLHVGTPSLFALRPAAELFARQVVIRLTQAPRGADGAIDKTAMAHACQAELARQLQRLGVQAGIELGGRREITVQGRRVLGFAVRLHGLSNEDSLRVQAHGLGGKRAMGCGVFGPLRPSQDSARKGA